MAQKHSFDYPAASPHSRLLVWLWEDSRRIYGAALVAATLSFLAFLAIAHAYRLDTFWTLAWCLVIGLAWVVMGTLIHLVLYAIVSAEESDHDCY